LTRHCCVALLAATVMAAGCGNSPSTMTGPTAQGLSGVPNSTISDPMAGGRFSLRECSGTTFVGPIRLPISVHGTTITMSWLGSDDAVRGYELEFQRSDASNGFIFAMHDTVVKPEATEFLEDWRDLSCPCAWPVLQQRYRPYGPTGLFSRPTRKTKTLQLHRRPR
jgi:hypothetical protein